MKITVVPAQVTTVEDRIMGNLGFSQMLLLVVPIFFSGMLYAILPPAMESGTYKYIIMGVIAFVCGLLAIRIKGKILAHWIVTILRYNLRPKYYLFNKNVAAYRQDYVTVQTREESKHPENLRPIRKMTPKLGLHETAKVLETIENPAAKLHFEMKRKGGLHVRLTEVQK